MNRKMNITTLLAASVDIGESGMPGSDATEITCEIYARRDGRTWEAVGNYQSGTNQGYFDGNHEYGPWRGRGATPQAAVDDMIRRATEYRDDMRRAGHDALLGADGKTFATLAAAEAERIESILRKGERAGVAYAKIGTEKYYVDSAERDALRRRAIQLLRRLAAGSPETTLSECSDSQLLAELARRGMDVPA